MIPFFVWLMARCLKRELRVKEVLLPFSLVAYVALAAIWVAVTIDADLLDDTTEVAIWGAVILLWLVLVLSAALAFVLLSGSSRKKIAAEESDRDRPHRQ